MADAPIDEARRAATERVRNAPVGAPPAAERLEAYIDGLVESSLVIARSRLEPERFVRVCGPVTDRPSTVMMAGLDNPDTDYWQAPISPDATYVIEGRRGSSADLSFQLLTGDYDDTAALPASAGTLTLRELHCEDDGSYRIQIGPDATGPNALVPTEPAGMAFCRETFTDWATERPGTMELRRLHGEPLAVPTDDVEGLAAELIRRRVDVWLQFAPGADPDILQAGFLHLIDPNTLVGPLQTSGGLPDQFSASGRFALSEDEALIVTVAPAHAPYLGIQVGDDLFASLPYLDRCSSRTVAQSDADSDGLVRWVISPRDPGVRNWVDTCGAPQGFVFIRWQGLGPDEAPPAPDLQAVGIADLSEALPAESRVDHAERERELSARRAALHASGRIRADPSA